MNNKEAIKILKPLFEQCKGINGCLGHIEHFFTKQEEVALDIAIKALEAEEIKSDFVPVIVSDGFYKFDGILDRKRQLIYGIPCTAEYVRDVLGMTWKEADNG